MVCLDPIGGCFTPLQTVIAVAITIILVVFAIILGRKVRKLELKKARISG